MKIKLSELENIIVGLGSLGEKRLPVRLSYAAAKNRKALMAEYETLMEQRKSILEANCLKGEDGKPVFDENNAYQYSTTETKKEVLSAVGELLNTETEIGIMQVPLEVIEHCDEPGFDTLTGAEITTIEFMITD